MKYKLYKMQNNCQSFQFSIMNDIPKFIDWALSESADGLVFPIKRVVTVPLDRLIENNIKMAAIEELGIIVYSIQTGVPTSPES